MNSEAILSPFHRTLLNIGICLATFLIVLDYSIANVAIPYIAGDLGVSVDNGTYVITSFAVGNAIVLPMSGWLTKRFGMVNILVVALLLFVFFSIFCASSYSFLMLIAGRFLQGFVSGPLIPLSQSLLVSSNPPEKKNFLMGFWGFVLITAPVFGPVIGGWLTYNYSWPWIFYINVPVGLLSAFTIWFFSKNRKETTTKEGIDWIGFCLVTLGVASLQIFLDKGQDWDWFRSSTICILMVVMAISFTFLFAWEFFYKKPFLELRLFRIRSFMASTILVAFLYAMYFGTVVLVPLWLQTNMGYTAPWAGMAVAPIGVVPMLCSLFMGKLVSKYGAVLPLCFSCLFFALASGYTAYFDTDVNFSHIAFSRFLMGFGIVAFATPLMILVIRDMPTEKLASATGFFHFVRAMFGGVGTSLFTTMWERRTIYHHNTLVATLSPFEENTSQYLSDIQALGLKGESSLALLNNVTDHQAAMLALNDCFYWMMWAFLALIPFLLWMYALDRKKVIYLSPPA